MMSVGIVGGGGAGLQREGQTTWPGFGVAASAVSGILAAEAALERATV